MRNSLFITALVLIPVFILIADDISWEKLSLRYIGKIGDRTDAHSKFIELGYTDVLSYENFRYRQLILIFLAISTELLASISLNLPMATFIALGVFIVLSIFLLTEQKLNRELNAYRDSIESDFPSIVEALTLSLSAGESPLLSMQRIALRGRGALIKEFSTVISAVTEGEPFATALDSMGRRVKSVAVRRFVDSVVIAITRGAPLIDVLHSHAREARDFQRNRVLSAASKAEISMMIPVVFLILPISILFALWPSLSNLNLFAQG
jgi:tight adherence protein C